MCETDWLTSTSVHELLKVVQNVVSDRKLRLFGCACCRRIWDSLPRDENRNLIVAMEDDPDGEFDDPDLFHAITASSTLRIGLLQRRRLLGC